MRTMYDGITPARVPAGGDLYAGYVGGQWPSYAGMVTLYPDAVHVSIAVQADEDAQVLDVENFDATPAESVGWAQRQRERGQVPTVYCNTSTWPAVQAAFAAAGVDLPVWWAAQYDGVAQLVPGSIAKQYQSTPGYDVSVVADHWPGVDPAPPTPTPKDDDVPYINDSLAPGERRPIILGGKFKALSLLSTHAPGNVRVAIGSQGPNPAWRGWGTDPIDPGVAVPYQQRVTTALGVGDQQAELFNTGTVPVCFEIM